MRCLITLWKQEIMGQTKLTKNWSSSTGDAMYMWDLCISVYICVYKEGERREGYFDEDDAVSLTIQLTNRKEMNDKQRLTNKGKVFMIL